jgi:ABC-type multidrug transport system permease subunit
MQYRHNCNSKICAVLVYCFENFILSTSIGLLIIYSLILSVVVGAILSIILNEYLAFFLGFLFYGIAHWSYRDGSYQKLQEAIRTGREK